MYSCWECRRAFANIQDPQNPSCTKMDLTLNTMSYDASAEYDSTALQGITWGSNDNKATLANYCEFVNEDISHCIKCKANYTTYYKSNSLDDLINNTNG